MTAQVSDTIIEKIRNLLAMAEHENSNEHEAALAMERAQDLLLKHNLTRADIKVNGEPSTPPGIGVIDRIENDGFSWKRILINTIALKTLCYIVVSPSKNTWHLFGSYDNVRAVLEMYQWIVPELERVALPAWKRYKADGGTETARTWKAGFFTGAISAIRERLAKPYDDFAKGAGTAIVIYNDKALKAAVHKVFPVLGHSSVGGGGYDGRSAGRQAGNGITLAPQRKLSGGTLRLAAG